MIDCSINDYPKNLCDEIGSKVGSTYKDGICTFKTLPKACENMKQGSSRNKQSSSRNKPGSSRNKPSSIRNKPGSTRKIKHDLKKGSKKRDIFNKDKTSRPRDLKSLINK